MESAGDDVVIPLRSLLAVDELAQSFDAGRMKLEAEATRILSRATASEQGTPSSSLDAQSSVIRDASGLEDLLGTLRSELEDGPLEVTWRRTSE
jgi:hypothetical protein